MSKQIFNQPLLYLIASQIPGRPITNTVAGAIEGGVDVVQLREKSLTKEQILPLAKAISTIVKQKGKIFLVNHHLEVALAVGADGVHLGHRGPTIREARKMLGSQAIIGASVHNLEEGKRAVEDGADYLLVSHIFHTDSKPSLPPNGLELLSQAMESFSLPVIALGGINASNIRQVAAMGCPRVAVMSAILKADDPQDVAKSLKDIL
ncbi:MAG: thiamine phosphate synthase [Thermincolia bacterium]